MKILPVHGRTLALLGVIVPLLALFVYVGLRSGPLAPVAVTVVDVKSRTIAPALFGIGTVEARYTFKIGPTFTGRLKRLDVHVGDQVKGGQVLGEMDPVDIDDRIRSGQSAIKHAQAALREARARQSYASTQAQRYEKLFERHLVSEEIVVTKRQELQISDAVLSSAREDLARARSDNEGLIALRLDLRLIAPVDGLIAERAVDPGTTVVAGQTVVEILDPKSLWVNVRFDQISAAGLASDLPARIVLRSRNGQSLQGRVLRVEPTADAVTEELLAKVLFDAIPQPFPAVGELAEVTVDLPALPAAPTIPNVAVHRQGDTAGVWRIVDGAARFTPVSLGASDLDGNVQVSDGLKAGDQVVAYSEKALTAHSRIHVVGRTPGLPR
jgi:RND family efflux transporter MFP subunit